MFDFVEPLWEIVKNHLSDEVTLSFWMGSAYTFCAGSLLVWMNSEPNIEPEDIRESISTLVHKEIIRKLNSNRRLMMSIRDDHNSLADGITENEEEISDVRRHFEFRLDMRTAENKDIITKLHNINLRLDDLEDIKDKIEYIEQNIIIEYSDDE